VLETYAELQQIIEDYLEQEDVSGKIPTFIRLAESRFDRELSVRWMETIFEGDIDQQEVPLPVDFLELRSLYLTSHSPWLLAKPRPQHLFFSSSVSSLSGIPRLYTIIGSSLFFAPDPTGVDAGTYPFQMYYRQMVPKLSTNNPTNWLLDLAPDVYLYASLLEAQPYLIDDERLQVWAQMYKQAKDSLISLDVRGRGRPFGEARPRSGFNDGKVNTRY